MRARGRREPWAACSSIQEERGGPGGHREWLSLRHHVRRCHLMERLHVRWRGCCELFIAAAQAQAAAARSHLTLWLRA